MRCWLLLALAGQLCIHAGEMTLVRDGKPQSVILMNAEKNTKSAQMGALELQYHIEKVTGAKLPIVTTPQKGKISIRLGGENAGMIAGAQRIRAGQDFILLTGNDTQNFKKVEYGDVNTFPLAFQFCNGTLFAVYDFLEQYCGVRFLYPGDKSTVVKPRKTLTVNVKDKDFESPVDGFRFVYMDDLNLLPNQLSTRDYELWKMRWRMCCFFGRTNHNQYSIYFAHWGQAKNKKLAKAFKGKHEEMFSQGWKGKRYPVDGILRVNYPDDPDIPPQLCYSNQDTVHYYAKEVLTYAGGRNVIGGWNNSSGDYPETKNVLPRYPGKPFFYPIQGGDTGGHCLCKNCLKRFPNDTEDDVSNNKYQFIADIAREAAQTDPSAGVSTLAYIQTLRYPDKVKLPPNVSVQLCLPIYSWWHPVAYAKQFNEYKKWIDLEGKKRPLTLWTYLFSTYWDSHYHFADYTPFPGLYPWQTGKLFKKFTADGIRGWFTEVEMRYNFLEAYVAARICYDPSLNPDEVIDDYFDYAFGGAAPYVKEFYKEIENAYWNPEIPKEWLKDPNVVRGSNGPKHPFWTTGLWGPEFNWKLGTPQRMKKLSGLLKEAEKRVKTDTEKQYLARLNAIWQATENGKKEHERFLKSKQIPIRSLKINQSTELNGDFNRVNFAASPVTEKWGTINGNEADCRCSVRVAADSKWLYLEFRDPKGADIHASNQDDFEIFMPDKDQSHIYQLCISPRGKIDQLRYTRKNDKFSNVPYDFKLKSFNRIENGDWTVRLAIPRDRLPFDGNELSINFFRTDKPENGPHKAWNPIFTGIYLRGADRSGKIVIFPQTIQESEFYKYKKGHESGECVDSAADNGVTAWMNASSSWALRYNARPTFPAGKYLISARLRAETATPNATSFTIGIYDMKTKKVTLSRKILTSRCTGKDFQSVDIGVGEFGPDMSFFVSGFVPKESTGKIFIDSIRFSLPEQK